MPNQPTRVAKPRPQSTLSATQAAAKDALSGESSATTSESPSTASGSAPWSAVSKVSRVQGLTFGIFGMPGTGKSTFGASATSSPHGRELLLINFDGDLKSLEDRDDIMTWPGEKLGGKIRDWKQFAAFSSELVRKKHPFKTLQFDTVNAMYELAYKHVVGSGSPNRDGRQIFGEANDLVLEQITIWTMQARENGINTIFVMHAEEIKDGENGPLVLRPQVTPGVIKGMYQKISTVGCLVELPQSKRKLYLHNTSRIVAKVHQPRTGAKLPLEIVNPDLGMMIEHFKRVKPYPTKENAA